MFHVLASSSERRNFSASSTHEIICKRLTLSIVVRLADDFGFFMRDFHCKRQFTEPSTKTKRQRGEKTVKKLCNLVIVKFYLLFTR